MTLSRSEINKRYNAKNASKLCENAISYYNANKERISARRRELYAIKKEQAIIDRANYQRTIEEMGPEVLSQLRYTEG